MPGTGLPLPLGSIGPCSRRTSRLRESLPRGPLLSRCLEGWEDSRGWAVGRPEAALLLTPSFPQMGGPGPLGEKVSIAQLLGAPAAPRQAPGAAAPGPEASDLVPSVSLALVLLLLFVLLSAWLVWERLLHTSG